MTDLEEMVKEADVVCFELMGVLVERQVCRPEDVFRFSQECFNARSGRYLTAELAPHRSEAERELKDGASGSGQSPESVSLDAIYQRVAKAMDLDRTTVDLLGRSELEAERHLIRARPVAADLVAFAAEQGKRVIVVGDTYLPRSFVEDVLAGLGAPDPSELVLSCETGVSLAGGAIWPTILRGNPDRRIVFIGATADGAEAATLQGVDATVLRPSTETYRAQLGPFGALNGPRVFRHLEVDGWRLKNVHRSMLNALVAGRGAASVPSAVTMAGYGALGPLVTGFVQWVHRQASRGGADRLVFGGPGGPFLDSAYRSLWADSALRTEVAPECDGGERSPTTVGRPYLVSSGWDVASRRWTRGRASEVDPDPSPPRLTFGIESGQEVVPKAATELAFVDGRTRVLGHLADDLLGSSPGLLQCALAGTNTTSDPDAAALVAELRAGALDFVADFAVLGEGLPSTLAVVDHQTSCETMVMLLNFPSPLAVPVLDRFRRAAGFETPEHPSGPTGPG